MATQDYWLNKRRLLVFSRLFVVAYLGGLLYWLAAQVWLAEDPVTVLHNDFAGFWSIGQMVLEGRALDAYLPDNAYAAQAARVPQHELRLPWFYPPQFFFLVGPLAALPYLAAFILWSAGTLACLGLSIRLLAPNTPTVWLLLASPALIWALRWGQTGVLAAALLGGALYFMARGQSIRAGILIGLLTFKPQLGVLLPFALIAGKEWRVFAAAALTTLALAGASTLAFGIEVWPRFFDAMDLAVALQASGTLPHGQMASLYAPLRTFGLSHDAALWLQVLLALAVLFLVLRVWLRLGASLLPGALLVAGSLLVSPHILGYDLMVFAPAVAILAFDGVRRGWLPGERPGYILLWFWPLFADVIVELTGLPLGVAGSLLLFALALRRCHTERLADERVETC